MYEATDSSGAQVRASLIQGLGGDWLIDLSVTSIIGITNFAWLDPAAARELAIHILARCDEAATTAAGSRLAPAAARAESGLIGTIVRRADDDAPVPQTGIITGTWLDTEGDLTCYVAWGCYSLDEVSAAVPEWHDQLTPASLGPLPAREFDQLITDLAQAVADRRADRAGQRDDERQAEGKAFAAHLMAERGWRQP